MLYAVTALFDRPINGATSREAANTDHERVFAETSESAARMWLWKMSAEEREATIRVIVSAPMATHYVPYPIYRGADVEFVRVGGKLEMVDPATAPPAEH